MPITAISSQHYIKQQDSSCIGEARPGDSLARRFVQTVVASNWEEDILKQEKWLNGICLGIVAFSVLYLTPILVAVLLK